MENISRKIKRYNETNLLHKKRASRGGLTVPSLSLINNTILDFADTELKKKKQFTKKKFYM